MIPFAVVAIVVQGLILIAALIMSGYAAEGTFWLADRPPCRTAEAAE